MVNVAHVVREEIKNLCQRVLGIMLCFSIGHFLKLFGIRFYLDLTGIEFIVVSCLIIMYMFVDSIYKKLIATHSTANLAANFAAQTIIAFVFVTVIWLLAVNFQMPALYIFALGIVLDVYFMKGEWNFSVK